MLEFEIYELLEKYGIKVPKYEVFNNYQHIYFDKFPAVLKIASKKIVHKSDVGGVRLGIDSNEELEAARSEMIKELQSRGIFLDNDDWFIVEEQVEGEEFYIGGVFDAIFEEVLLFGKGGTLLEIEKDICYIDVYSDDEEIVKSFKTTKISKIFPKYRGKEYKMEYVVDVVKKFQRFFLEQDVVEFDVNPLIYTPQGFVAVDARLKMGPKVHKEHIVKTGLFKNEKVAIIGATNKEEKVGYALAKNALKSSCEVYFVNPRIERLFSKKVYKSVSELPPIDTAAIAIKAEYVIDTLKELIKKGVKNVIIISAGFKEAGNAQAEEEISRLAKEHNIIVVGPNCLGIYNSEKHLNLTFAKDEIYPGHLGLVSQSGAVLSALIDKAATYSIGFSHIISLGNMADFNFASSIKELNQRSGCRYISIYAEGLKDGKAYLQQIRESKKEIEVYKAGKTKEAKRAAYTHTGNISGDYEMLRGLSYAAGAKIKEDIDSLIFSMMYERFESVIILTNAGGPGTILTDIVVQSGKKLYTLSDEDIKRLDEVLPPNWSKNNPVDIIGDATSRRYQAALEVLGEKEALILGIVTPQFMTDALNIARVFLDYKNLVPIFFGSEAFKDVFEFYKEQRVLYFDDLENVQNIL